MFVFLKSSYVKCNTRACGLQTIMDEGREKGPAVRPAELWSYVVLTRSQASMLR